MPKSPVFLEVPSAQYPQYRVESGTSPTWAVVPIGFAFMASSTRRSATSILGLPLSASPIHFLGPDPILPTPSALFSLSDLSQPPQPTVLRRSRPVNGAFSYVTPLPKAFPYAITPPPNNLLPTDHIETFLAALEPRIGYPPVRPVAPWSQAAPAGSASSAGGYTSAERTSHYQALQPKLLSISRRAAEDCLPGLDLGTQEDSPARVELLKVLSGELIIGRLPETQEQLRAETSSPDDDLVRRKGFGPWSLAYAGHQFGHFAGQLGDGRAISILSTPCTPSGLIKAFNLPIGSITKAVVEIQLKGAGRTPFSRFADGLALLRSSIREHLASEFAATLHSFPTSRSLALLSLPGLQVERERVGKAGLVARLAPSWIRVGSFELFRSREDWRGLEELVEFVGYEIFGIEKSGHVQDQDSLAIRVVREVMHRNARMVAAWQAWGFMHGVINTDNISILGLTIDYGPYAFMDIFNPHHVCNHSDDSGRYSYSQQPDMVKYAIDKLADSIAELVGFQITRPSSSFTEAVVTRENREKLGHVGRLAIANVLNGFEQIYVSHYTSLMRMRLGLSTAHSSDLTEIIEPLLKLMTDRSDYAQTFCTLSDVHSPSFPTTISTPALPHLGTPKDWSSWIDRYRARLRLETEDWEQWKARMDKFNPRFILRQWVLEAAIEDESLLELVMGLIDGGDPVGDKEAWLCGLGPKAMIGFQCSCSS